MPTTGQGKRRDGARPKGVPAPFGTWASPISAQMVAEQGLRLGFVAIDGDAVYWLEGRPGEGGRTALVKRAPDGTVSDVTPGDVSVRTRVHEYGGGAYLVHAGMAYYSNYSDQRVYRIAASAGESADAPSAPERPEPLTPAGNWFYADYQMDVGRNRLICVREDHSTAGSEPVNTLVSIAIPAIGASFEATPGEVLVSGHDFYSTPRLSPDGSRLAWICWRHPNMPWDSTELWVADVSPDGTLANARRVAGGQEESVMQPGWSPDGTLYFVSDLSGWWHIYRLHAGHDLGMTQLTGEPWLEDAEFGRPQWQSGSVGWAFAGPSRIVAAYTRRGRWRLALVDPDEGGVTDLITQLDPAEWLAATADSVVFVGGSLTRPQAVVKCHFETGVVDVLRPSSSADLEPGYVSQPIALVFPTDGERSAHAFYYAPRNKDFAPLPDALPPLIVISHGGPTMATRATLDLQIQYWTSRGFAVVDVNYGGSSGYGRAYRELLNGQWGVVDVADCVNAARYLVLEGQVDERRLAIRGGSAGGYTTLAALTFHPDLFAAGASYYGVSDIEILARDTHKFESRYLDSLVGPYPAARDLYRARSPIHFVDRLACSLILFQGTEDKVVPPNQAEMMAAAVRAKGLPVALLLFKGEQHGFRQAATIIRCLEAELYFYGVVFGFVPADRLDPIEMTGV